MSLSIDVESTVEDVQAELDSLSADAIDVPVEADVSTAESEIQSLDAQPVEVPVEADTTQAQAEVASLGESVSDVTGQLAEGSGALGDFGGAAGLAGGELGGLDAGLGSVATRAGGAAAGVGVVATAFTEFATQGIEALSVEQRFANATGELGDQIRQIDVGGLNTDLGDLAISLGGSDEAALAAATNLALIGEQAGLTDSEISSFTDGLFAFEAAAISSGLASGSLGDNTQRLASGFARGGRFLQNFGVSLTSAEIAQQALLETGKESASQLTQIEKAQAGLNLALAQNPDLAAQVAAGQANIGTQVEATKSRFSEFTEEIGKPLAAEFVTILDESVPAAEAAAEGLGVVAETFGNVAAGAASVIGPIADVSSALMELNFLDLPDEGPLGVLFNSAGTLGNLRDGGDLAKGVTAVNESLDQTPEATAAADAALQQIAGTLPTVADSFSQVQSAQDGLAEGFGILNASSDPTILADNIQQQADLLNTFFNNLNTIADAGFAQLAGTLQQIGPEAAGLAFQLAAALESGDLTEAARLQNAISNLEDASGRITGLGTETGAGFTQAAEGAISTGSEAVGAAADAAGQAAALGVAAGFSIAVSLISAQMTLASVAVAVGGVQMTATATQVGSQSGLALGQGFATTAPIFVGVGFVSVNTALITGSISTSSVARSAGLSIGRALGQGIEQGIREQTASIASEARAAVLDAADAARAAAQVSSPSKLFATIGEQMGAGLALGFERGASALVAEAQAVTFNAAGAVGSTSTSVGGVVVNQVIEGGMSPGDARPIRKATRDGVRDGLAVAFDVANA